MDFELTDEQELLQRAVREFAEGEIAPGAAERDEHGRFPAELIPKLAEQGLALDRPVAGLHVLP